MRFPNFVGPSYQSQSILADVEECLNFYPEQIESVGGKVQWVLYPTPGQKPFVLVPDVSTRALFAMAGRAFGIVGPGLYEIFANMKATKYGTVLPDANPSTMSENGAAQLLATSGNKGYLLNLTTNALSTVVASGATMSGMIDGYFIVFDPVNNKFSISKLLDGTSWDPTQFAQRSAQADPWKAMLVGAGKDLWLIGEQTGEVWYDAGSFPFPFAPYPGANFKWGIAAPFSLALVGQSPIWLSQNSDGNGIVVKSTGYYPQDVSSHAVETAIAGYQRTSRIDDAIGWAYQDQGHLFYNLSFPTPKVTWTYDDKTNLWHKRGTWIPNNNAYDAWHPRAHCFAFGQHLVGDTQTGSINTMDVTIATEADGTAIRRVRIPPGLFQERQRITIDSLEIYLESGLGLEVGQGADPTVMLEVSRDGGKTWGSIRTASAGTRGRYKKRVLFTRLGSSKDMVIRLTFSDPILWRIIDAYINEPLGTDAEAGAA